MSSGNPIEHGIPTRQPAVALLCVNSADAEKFNKTTGEREDWNYPNRILINNQSPLLFGYMTRLILTEICLQWSSPNVNPYNNTITIMCDKGDDALVVRVSVPVGWYTPTQLATALQTALRNAFQTFLGVDNTWETNVSPTTGQFSILTGTGNFSFYVVPGRATNVGLSPVQDDLCNMLGLTPSDAGEPYTSITGGYASYQYTPYIDIVSSLLTKNQNVRDSDTSKQAQGNFLARVYLANEDISPTDYVNGTNIPGCRPFLFKREFKTPKVINWNTSENVDSIDISIVDYLGNPLYMPPKINNVGVSYTVGNTADLFFTIQAQEQ